MHVAIACGGTGGHALPGLMTARALQRRGHSLTLWLTGRDAEAGALKGWEGPVVRLVARGFESRWTQGGFGIAAGQVRATWQALPAMRRQRPDVLLGMGSYSSVPPVLAARLLGVPVVLHEANAIPGRAVTFLAPFAQAVGLTFAAAAEHLPRRRTVVTGLPMRPFTAAPFAEPPLREGVFTVLVMGGSQGAHVLNELATAALAELHHQRQPLQVIHLAGKRDESQVRAAYAASGVPHLVFPFLEEVERAYGRANLAVCRSGAGTCMELARVGLPAILVPLPDARRDHQARNAEQLSQCGGARVIRQDALTPASLAAEIAGFMEAPERLAAMRQALRGLAIDDGAERLADLVEAVASKKR